MFVHFVVVGKTPDVRVVLVAEDVHLDRVRLEIKQIITRCVLVASIEIEPVAVERQGGIFLIVAIVRCPGGEKR